VLTARDLVDDRVAGLDASAADYLALAKPFTVTDPRAHARNFAGRNSYTSEFAHRAPTTSYARDAHATAAYQIDG
jgi:two-component system response regulator MprA